jgi:hypothetical protein
MLSGGALDGPQVVAILMVLAGGLVLMERATTVEDSGFPPFPQKEAERMGHGASGGSEAKTEGSGSKSERFGVKDEAAND